MVKPHVAFGGESNFEEYDDPQVHATKFVKKVHLLGSIIVERRREVMKEERASQQEANPSTTAHEDVGRIDIEKDVEIEEEKGGDDEAENVV
nr:hypothetical protein Itr_chr08CG12260 [Ipomoea trifida]